MSGTLQRAGADALQTTGARRSYRLALAPDPVMGLVRKQIGLPVLSEPQAEQSTPRRPFVVMADSGFVIYKPWASMRELGREGAMSADITLGPAVEARVVPMGAGSQVDVRIRRYAPPPSQRRRFALAAVVFAAFVVLPLVLGGVHPVAIGLSALSLLGGFAALAHRRSDREQDVRELLASVERVLGPAELGTGRDTPHRRLGEATSDDP